MTPSTPTVLDRRFVRHVAGTMALMEWQRAWERRARDLRWQGCMLTLPDLVSQRFGLACPRHPGAARHPALLVQQEERRWMERLAWREGLVNEDTGELALLARPWHTPSGFMPGFAVVIQVGPMEKWNWLGATGTLESRALWWEDSEEPHVSNGPALARWTLTRHPSSAWRAAIEHHAMNGEPLYAASGNHDRLHRMTQPRRRTHVGSQ